MDFEADLSGIRSLARMHIEIRNRSWMKRIHRDCFIGSDFVDFLVNQGLAGSRLDAVNIGKKMISSKLIKHITSSGSFKDAYLYYRFAEDDDSSTAVLAATNAGNGSGSSFLGLGGCKWSIAPHTAHNSFVLDISLAEDLERAVSGASVEARARAIQTLRNRVIEQADPSAPDWKILSSSSMGEGEKTINTHVYERTRPRGDFKNIKMTTTVTDHSPRSFVASIVDFDKRKLWETMFEDGVVVETIDIGEGPNKVFATDAEGGVEESEDLLPSTPALPDSGPNPTVARKVDDVMSFLQTVDLAGIPDGIPIAFLNEPERQHALAHLRKQMMYSNPQECMLCTAAFSSPRDIRFCPNCSMVCCASCVSKRVFEVASRQLVNVCVHCYRSSSRIRHPPTALKCAKGVKDENMLGKWWRPEELGMVDHSMTAAAAEAAGGTNSVDTVESSLGGDFTEEDDVVAPGGVPLIPGLLDADAADDGASDSLPSPTGASSPTPPEPPAVAKSKSTARCKACGEAISRNVSEIEAHMEVCTGNSADATSRRMSTAGGPTTSMYDTYSNAKSFAGVTRKSPEVTNKVATRIIYRTARATTSKLYSPREVCVLQDSFMDGDRCFMYEISVRHCEVHGIPTYVTADVMFLLHVATPIPKSPNKCNVTVISQIDHRASTGTSEWLVSLVTNGRHGGGTGISNHSALGVSRRDELVRELKSSGKLHNILRPTGVDGAEDAPSSEDEGVCLDDFELMAVLGRGGFGKVMQVRHKTTDIVYAMKILKKSELKRRRQVERTQTERTILANVRHPFIVCLYYAFQNDHKLYMVMDFVQGGDFFTLMRKFKRLPEDWVRLYVAEIAMALQHLHDMDVVYRDLKPENILLCRDGHLKLTDFGLSRFFESRPPAPEDIIADDDVVTRSFCGTEQYMSPEMLLQQGHNWRMDWWCLGLLMHEMISARHPFHGPSHYDTLRNMVTKQPLIDQRLSSLAVTVVRSLLIKNPKARCCCTQGIKELKNLPFFAGFDWDGVENMRVKAPYAPDISSASDISSFEATFTREAAVDSITKDSGTNKDGSKKEGGYILWSYCLVTFPRFCFNCILLLYIVCRLYEENVRYRW